MPPGSERAACLDAVHHRRTFAGAEALQGVERGAAGLLGAADGDLVAACTICLRKRAEPGTERGGGRVPGRAAALVARRACPEGPASSTRPA